MRRFLLQTVLVGLLVQLVAIVAFKAFPSALLKSCPSHHRTVPSFRITPAAVGISKSPKFSMPPQHQPRQGDAEKKDALLKQNIDSVAKVFAVSILSAFLWSSPLITSQPHDGHLRFGLDNNIAIAKEMASGSGSRVNKDPESLLRYGLPIDNQEVRNLQGLIERIGYDISSKRTKAALDGTKKSRVILNQSSKKLTASCAPDESGCKSIIENMINLLDKVEDALVSASNNLYGSDQEREALDKAYKADDDLLKQLTSLEEKMIPKGYKPTVPAEYSDLPQLLGRATVEMVLKKPDGSPFNVEGTLVKDAKLKMVIDGYNAPITGGNFVELVNKGFYKNMAIQRSDGFVVQTGNPDGEAEGYVGTPSKAVGAGPHGERLIPLEIMMKGDKTPIYSSTMEDEGRGGQATVLPFSSYGAMGWAREEYEPDSGSSQFFWLLFDSDLTPAGKNVLDGRYPCFGYVVEGADLLRDVKEGDIIVTATVTSGLENLFLPSKA